MVGEPADIDVSELIFDERNLAHLADHGVTAHDVSAVFGTAPRFFSNLAGRSGTHVMLGPDGQGTFYYVVLAELTQGTWRVITAYRYSRRRALRYYRGQT